MSLYLSMLNAIHTGNNVHRVLCHAESGQVGGAWYLFGGINLDGQSRKGPRGTKPRWFGGHTTMQTDVNAYKKELTAQILSYDSDNNAKTETK